MAQGKGDLRVPGQQRCEEAPERGAEKLGRAFGWAGTCQCMSLSTWILSSVCANWLQWLSPDHRRKELVGSVGTTMGIKGPTQLCTFPHRCCGERTGLLDCSLLPSQVLFAPSPLPPPLFFSFPCLEYDRLLQRTLLKLRKPVFSQKKSNSKWPNACYKDTWLKQIQHTV